MGLPIVEKTKLSEQTLKRQLLQMEMDNQTPSHLTG